MICWCDISLVSRFGTILSFLSFHDLNMFDDNKSVLLLYVFQFGFLVLLAFLKKKKSVNVHHVLLNWCQDLGGEGEAG